MSEDQPSEGSGLAGVTVHVVGLGREVEALRRVVDRHERTTQTVADRLADLESRVGSSAATLVDLAEQIGELASGGQVSSAHQSWFDTTDSVQGQSRLDDLARWLDRVYFQFPDAALPSCWIWHPSVVEELLWLRRSWTEAFTGSTAAIFRVADWHDRQRPGVVARIRALNDGVCSLEQHAAGAEQDRRPPTTPAVDAVPLIADWWTSRRSEPPPYPSEAQSGKRVDGRR